MSNPTELPDLDKLELDFLEELSNAADTDPIACMGFSSNLTPDTVLALIALARRPPVPAQRPTDDELWDSTIRDRDTYHEWADKLADAIASYFGVDIGEHSNQNCPWHEALEAIESAEPARRAQPEGLSIALREVTDKLSATAAENLSLNLSNIDLRDQLARLTAQPEGEAPQAEANGLPLDVEFKQLADTILQATTNGARLEALRSMAALFDKHAESGADWTGVEKRGVFLGQHGAPGGWHMKAGRHDGVATLFLGRHGYVELNGKFNVELTAERCKVMHEAAQSQGPQDEIFRLQRLLAYKDGQIAALTAKAAQLDGGQEGSESNG